MDVTYTALRNLNTSDTPIDVYDFGGNAGYFRSSASFIDRAQSWSVTLKFNIDSFHTYPLLFRVQSCLSLLVTTDGRIRVYKDCDGVISPVPILGTTFDDMTVSTGREQIVTLTWDGAGNFTVTKDGATESGTVQTYTSTNCWVQIGYHTSNTIDGFVYDVTMDANGSSVAAWGCHEGTGTVFNDSVSSYDLTLAGTGSPEPDGWMTYTPQHYADTEYNMTVLLSRLENERRTVKQEQRSLSGATQTTVQRVDEIQSCTTIPVNGATARNFREFLSSVDQGEQFDFNDGSGDSAKVLEGQFRESRRIQRGDGGDNDFFVFSWKHRAA